jgi:NaMN:DMB phosphoribosyltransferase
VTQEAIAALSIEPVSEVDAIAARARFSDPKLAAVAAVIGGARRGPPRVHRPALLIVAADSRPSLAATPVTAIAAGAIADGTAAVAQVCAGKASLVLIDAGCARPLSPPAIALMGTVDAGAAVVVSLVEAIGVDLLLLGALGSMTTAATDLMTGAILAAASLHVATVLDGDATGAAAVNAVARQSAVRGYLLAAHRGNRHVQALAITPIFDVGLGHGEGAGAAMLLPLLDQLRC